MIEPAPLTLGFYSRLFLVRKATGEWRPILDLSSLNVFVHCPSFTMETPRSILRALQQGQWFNIPRPERLLLSYRDRPSRQTLLTLLSQRHCLAVYSTAIRVVNQSESIYKILKPVLAFAHLHRVKLHMYIDDSLLNPGTHQEALEQTSWLKSLCRKLGLVF